MKLLAAITSMPDHRFWPDTLELTNAISKNVTLVGHRQVNDAYLVALAAARGGVLATLDRGTFAVTGGKRDLVELL